MSRTQNKPGRFRPSIEALESRWLLTTVWADFNNDGFDDLAIGVPGEDSGAGMVQVLRGSATGLSATGSQTFTQAILGTDSSEAGDKFGAALAAGDYNNDGFSDLAVGVPGEDVGAATDAGLVHFIFGSATGLTGLGDYVMHQDTNRVRDICETGDFFGKSLAAGDFDNDGFVDLGVGVPGQDVSGMEDSGGIHIFYGGGTGIKPPRNQGFNEDSPGMVGTANFGNLFGSAMAAGDFNGDSRADLAIGSPGTDLGTFFDSGVLIFVYASANGLAPTGSQIYAIGDNGGRLGSALASGDFDGDGLTDLAAGAPSGTLGAETRAGVIRTFNGTPTGLTSDAVLKQTNLGDGNVSETGDDWGAALTAGDFNNDGRDDVAIGAPGEDGAASASGQVDVLFGSTTGITVVGNLNLTEVSVGGTSELDDHFGETLAAGDFNGNGAADLAIGTPDEDVGAVVNAGTVYVLYGGATFTSPQTWTQDTAGIFDSAETGDGFGGGLDANGSKSAPGGGGRADLAHLITADEVELFLNKTNKRRYLGERR